MKNNLVFNFKYKLERLSPNIGVFSVDMMASTRFFAHPVAIHYTIFQSIGPIQYNTNTIQYLKELYPICNNILIHLIKILVES